MEAVAVQTERVDRTPPVRQGDPVLRADAIAKAFGPVMAVHDLSFDLHAGEVIGLLGPNGAGKTTSVRVLTTMYAPTRGSFSVAGIPHTQPTEIRRRIGVLPESGGYPLTWSGYDYLWYFARLFGHTTARAREMAMALLADVGLGSRAATPIEAYSRGMRQRLGVARALVNEPLVIFLDEPTLGLDPAGQRQILALIRDLARQRGTAIILSTHFLDEVEEVCSRVLILNHGAVVAEGTVAEIIRRAAPTTSRFRVPADMRERARLVLASVEGVSGVDDDVDDGEGLSATFETDWLDHHRTTGMNSAIRSLVDADIPILSCEIQRGRLSDAFLTITGEGLQ
jgi:ABC-2 type transport system ATP-binding protein